MAITAEMVRELRDRTGAGMMECKKALEATGGDFELAIDHLRKAGLKTADKKSSREMAEGRVHAVIAPDGRSGCMVAVQCETDFAAGTPDFGRLLEELAAHVLAHAPTGVAEGASPLLGQKWGRSNDTVELHIKGLIGKLGENVRVAGLRRFENKGGLVHAYVHHDHKQGALVTVTTQAERAAAQETLKGLCQHIVASRPPYLRREDVPAAAVERERAIYREEVKDKPANIQEKILTGKLEKFYAASVLLEQPWIFDDAVTVQKALERGLGAGTALVDFGRFRIGE